MAKAKGLRSLAESPVYGEFAVRTELLYGTAAAGLDKRRTQTVPEKVREGSKWTAVEHYYRVCNEYLASYSPLAFLYASAVEFRLVPDGASCRPSGARL